MALIIVREYFLFTVELPFDLTLNYFLRLSVHSVIDGAVCDEIVVEVIIVTCCGCRVIAFVFLFACLSLPLLILMINFKLGQRLLKDASLDLGSLSQLIHIW